MYIFFITIISVIEDNAYQLQRHYHHQYRCYCDYCYTYHDNKDIDGKDDMN